MAIRALGDAVLPRIKAAETLEDCDKAEAPFGSCRAELRFFQNQIFDKHHRIKIRKKLDAHKKALEPLIGQTVTYDRQSWADAVAGKPHRAVKLLGIKGNKAIVEEGGMKSRVDILYPAAARA